MSAEWGWSYLLSSAVLVLVLGEVMKFHAAKRRCIQNSPITGIVTTLVLTRMRASGCSRPGAPYAGAL